MASISAATRADPRVGVIRIRDGPARIALAERRADLEIAVLAGDGAGRQEQAIRAEVHGTYAGQPLPPRAQLTNGPMRRCSARWGS